MRILGFEVRRVRVPARTAEVTEETVERAGDKLDEDVKNVVRWIVDDVEEQADEWIAGMRTDNRGYPYALALGAGEKRTARRTRDALEAFFDGTLLKELKGREAKRCRRG